MALDECYGGLCSCVCGKQSPSFDNVVRSETAFSVSLQELCHSNVGWFPARLVTDLKHFGEWRIDGKKGIYLLWHKDGYCPTHERFHMRGLYVGKGNVLSRLRTHWERKDFSHELLVYWTFVEMPNRQAKYVEQLLLDTYDLPLNKSENAGTEILCAHLTQQEVD